MVVKQLAIFLENKGGRLSEITGILAKAGINISALSIADTSEYGILRLIVSDPEKALIALKREHISVHLSEVVCMSIANQPGSLARALKILSEGGISVEYMYAFAMGEQGFVVIKPDDNQVCLDTLRKHEADLFAPLEGPNKY